MATKEELFAAVRLLKQHCADHGPCARPKNCPLRRVGNSTEFNFGARRGLAALLDGMLDQLDQIGGGEG